MNKNDKRIIAIIIVLLIIVGNVIYFGGIAYSEPVSLTVSQLGSIIYGISDFSNLTFPFTNGTEGGAEDFIVGKINDYASGSSVANLFDLTDFRYTVGKIAIGHVLYNNIKTFLSDMIENMQDGQVVSKGQYDEIDIGNISTEFGTFGNLTVTQIDRSTGTSKQVGIHVGYGAINIDLVQTFTPISSGGNLDYIEKGWYLLQSGSKFYVRNAWDVYTSSGYYMTVYSSSSQFAISQSDIKNTITVNLSNYDQSPIQANEVWEGSVIGSSDTDLDELAESVYQDVSQNDLSMDAEIVEPGPAPTPVPTAVPTYPPAATELDALNTNIEQQDINNQQNQQIVNNTANIEQGINDLIDKTDYMEQGINDLIENTDGIESGINDLIGNTDGIETGINDLIGNTDGIESGINDLIGNTDGIEQGINDLIDGAGDITSALDDLKELEETIAGDITDAIEGVQEGVSDIAETLEDAMDVPSAQEAETFKFDLRTLFPFCIPFDIYNMLQAFDGVAAAPHYQIPIVIQSIGFSYTMDLDFAMFDSVAVVLRQVELIVFGVALAYATSKVIRW